MNLDTGKTGQENAVESHLEKGCIYLNRANMTGMIEASQENPAAMSVLLFFIEHADYRNEVFISYKDIQEFLGVSQATIARNVKYLKDKGFLSVRKAGSANVYVLNHDLVQIN